MHYKMFLYIICRKKFLVILVRVFLRMHGMDTTVHSLLMARLDLENHTQWLDMVLIKACFVPH